MSPHIRILQWMYGDFRHFAWSEWINRRYCEKHGYEYVRRSDAPNRTDRHVNWHKVSVILAELRECDCDYLLYIDADAHFYTYDLTVERELLPLMQGRPILMSADIGSEADRWNPDKPNSGVILMKATEQVQVFFEAWDRSSDLDPASCWTWPLEQMPLWNLVMPQFGDMVQVHPEYYQIHGRYGYFIRHHYLRSDDERTQLMKHFVDSYL